MKSFLVRDKIPIIKWTKLPENIMFEGEIPKDYDLAICPGKGHVVVDIDVRKDKNGFDSVPKDILNELKKTYNYNTKNNGTHFWLRYSGNKDLMNTASGLGIDLRVEYKGYVVYYPRDDFKLHIKEINKSSDKLNIWLESLFTTRRK